MIFRYKHTDKQTLHHYIYIIIIITTYSQVPRTRPRLYGHNRQLAPARDQNRPEATTAGASSAVRTHGPASLT